MLHQNLVAETCNNCAKFNNAKSKAFSCAITVCKFVAAVDCVFNKSPLGITPELNLALGSFYLIFTNFILNFAAFKFSFAKSIFKYPLTTNKEISFSIFCKSNILDSTPNCACLYVFVFLYPLKTVIPELTPKEPPKKVVFTLF